MLEIIANGVLENKNFNKLEVPNALYGLKYAASSANQIKPFTDKFKKILDLDLDDQNLNTNGSAIDLLSCEFFALIFLIKIKQNLILFSLYH